MEDLKLLSLSDLLDLLIEQTAHHTQLISVGASPQHQQFSVSREILRELQAEIELRKVAEKTDQVLSPSQDQSSLEFSN